MKYGVGLFILVVGLTGCAQAGESAHSGSSDAGGAAVNAAGLEAFKTSVYAYANSQGCVKCHGAIVTPKFASANLNEAYAAAKSVVDFNAVATSALVVYAGNSHCADQACSSPSNVAAISALVSQWIAGENSSSNNNNNGGTVTPPPSQAKFLTGSMALPATIPTIMVANPAVVRFPLSALNPPVSSLTNAILEVEVQMSNATTYRFRRPKIVGNSAAVNVKGVHLYIRPAELTGIGNEDVNQTLIWNMVDVIAAIFAKPATLPATPLGATPLSTSSVFYSKIGTGDVITIGFDDLK